MRIAIFTDANNGTARSLIRATLHLIDARADLECCGFVTSRPDAFRSSRGEEVRRWARRVAVAAFDPRTASRLTRRMRIDLHRVARERGIPLLSPGPAGLNDPGFVARVADTLRPDVALSYYGRTIWKAPLLAALPQAVNYHDGLLPEFRGVGATSFSIYRGAAESGFTFHRMVEAIDAGPILVQGAVPIGRRAFLEVDRAKTAAAVAALPAVLDRIVAHDPGRAQTGPGSYFSYREMTEIVHVTDPDTVTTAELERRIRAFEEIRLTLDGAAWPVTRVRPGRHGPLTFRTADGSWCSADRVLGLPPRFHRATPAR